MWQAANRSLQAQAWAVHGDGGGSSVGRRGHRHTSGPSGSPASCTGSGLEGLFSPSSGVCLEAGDGSQDRDPSPRHFPGPGAAPRSSPGTQPRGGPAPVKQVFISTPARFNVPSTFGEAPKGSPGASSSTSSPLGVFDGHNDFLFEDSTV